MSRPFWNRKRINDILLGTLIVLPAAFTYRETGMFWAGWLFGLGGLLILKALGWSRPQEYATDESGAAPRP